MPNPFIDAINQLLPEPQASLLNGILFGIRANLSRDLYQALITTGTIHIIALSGQNIAILTSILNKLTLPLGRKISCLLTVIGICGFVLFVGPEPTIVRAAIMGSLSVLAVYFGRKNWSLLTLVLAAGVMLLIEPVWIGEISFQLSFLATLGIIIFGPVRQSKANSLTGEIKRELKVAFNTTIAAQVFTLPLVFWVFGTISLVAPLSNVLIGPLIAYVMGLGLLTALLGWLFLPLGQVLGWIVWVPLTFILLVITLTAKIPFAAISF